MKLDEDNKQFLLIMWLLIPWVLVCVLTLIFVMWIVKQVLI